MRVPMGLVAALFCAMLMMDITSVWVVRHKVVNTIDQAMDAALVEGIKTDDAAGGRLILDEQEAAYTVKRYLKEHLLLDDSLENDYLKKTAIKTKLVYEKGRPKLTVDVDAIMVIMLPKMFGLEGVPIRVHNVQYHLSRYK